MTFSVAGLLIFRQLIYLFGINPFLICENVIGLTKC